MSDFTQRLAATRANAPLPNPTEHQLRMAGLTKAMREEKRRAKLAKDAAAARARRAANRAKGIKIARRIARRRKPEPGKLRVMF